MANIEHIEVTKQHHVSDVMTGVLDNQQWYWHWKAENGEKIATSGEPFYSKDDAYDAAERIVQRLENKFLPIRIIE